LVVSAAGCVQRLAWSCSIIFCPSATIDHAEDDQSESFHGLARG
jgi:hypothetical protein